MQRHSHSFQRWIFITTLVLTLFGSNCFAAVTITAPTDANSAANSATAYSAVGTVVGITANSTVSGITGANLALSHTIYVSSTEQAAFPGSQAVDGNYGTRWSSAFSDPQWITVDLGANYNINEVKLFWENAYGSSYQIQTSTDNSTFSPIYSTTTGPGGNEDLTGLSGIGRYIRMYGTARGTTYGYSLYEFEVYGSVTTAYSLTNSAGGLFTINSSTGVVTVNNAASLAPGTYSITVAATSGTATASSTFSINVYPAAPSVTGGGAICGAASKTLTASGGTPTGGTYNWYTASTGGILLQSTTSATYTFNAVATATYYVSYTVNGQTSATRTAVTVTVNPIVSSPLSGAIFSYPFTGNANDVSGNANNGTLQGSPTAATDRFGNASSAYTFNGSSQYISTATGSASPGPQNFSISVWFKTTTAGGMLVGYGSTQSGSTSASYDRHIYMNNTGQIYYGIYPTAVKTINTTATYIDGNWHHVIATTSTTTGSNLYVDGVLQATDATMTTSQVYGVNGYWRIGWDNLSAWTSAPTNYYFTGTLDDISVYNRALSSAEATSADNLNLIGTTSTAVCAGSPITLSAPAISGATFSWKDASGTVVTGQNATFPSAVAGSYTLTVTGGSGGCSSTATVTPTINTGASSTFSATSAVNTGGTATVTYTGTDPSASTYAWDFNGGTPSTGTGQGPFSVSWSTTGTKTITLTVTNAAGCSSTTTQNVTVTGSYGNYAFSKPLTLNTSSMGISTTLTSFPALVYIQDNDLKIGGACADMVQNPTGGATGYNYDFAFTLSGSTSELNYQVESYDQTNGKLLVWVQIPAVTSTNTALIFYFGAKSPSPAHTAATAAATWASDYLTVYHFDEGSATATVLDATSYANNAVQTSTATTTGQIRSAAGFTGGGYTFNGTGTKITSTSTANITGSFTLSAWVKVASFGSGPTYDQKVVTNEANGTSGGYKLSLYGTSATNVQDEVESRNSTGTVSYNRSATGGTALSTGTWYYVQGIYNSSTGSFYTYRNGVLDRSSTGAAAPATGSVLVMGTDFNATNWFNGVMDEVRVSNVAKSSDWIKAEYYNQTNPLTFTDYSASVAANATNAAAISGAVTYTWTGATSTDVSVASNWNNTTAGIANQLPAANGSSSIVIPSGLTNYPVMTYDGSCYGMTLGAGASINLNGHTLSVGCNIYNSSGGQVLYGSNISSGITWNGSAVTQTYTGSSTSATAQLGNMTINNSAAGTVTISSGPVDIYNTLTLTKGNLSIGSSPAALTLKSTSTNTASVAALGSGCTITGNVSVERYLSGGAGRRGYRLLSSPVYAATVNSNNVYTINYLQSSAYLTGWGGGFDKPGNPTIYLFREDLVPANGSFTDGNFWGISTINNSPSYNYYLNNISTNYNIPVGNGYMFFFRGNRASAPVGTETVTTYIPVAATLTATGTLNTGQIIVHDWFTPSSAYLSYTGNGTGTNAAVRGDNLVGNPYASSIDWEQFNTTSPTTGIYGNNVGITIYEFNEVTTNYDTYQHSVGSNPGVATNHGSRYIASGQAFYVVALPGGNPQLIFNESAKTSTQNPVLSNYFMSTKANVANLNDQNIDQHLRLQMAMDSINTDDIYIGFSQGAGSQYVFNEDSPYLAGGGKVGLASISADNVRLAINRLPLPKQQMQVIPLHVNAVNNGRYTLTRTELEAVPKIYEIWLMDAYKKDSLDMRNNTTYAFDLYKADTNSYGSKRFSLVLRQNPALGVHLLNFTAAKSVGGAQINWVTENEENYTNFVVQRSTDGGTTYTSLNGTLSSAQGTYSYLDPNPPVMADKYRLQLTDLNGTISYSTVITLMYGNTSNNLVTNTLNVYPNPTKGPLNVNIINSRNIGGSASQNAAGSVTYGIKIISNIGTVTQTATTADTAWSTDVSKLIPGSYVIQVINNSSQTVAGQGTFIKL